MQYTVSSAFEMKLRAEMLCVFVRHFFQSIKLLPLWQEPLPVVIGYAGIGDNNGQLLLLAGAPQSSQNASRNELVEKTINKQQK